MRRLALSLAVGLSLGACGSASRSLTVNPQAKADTAKAEATFNRCAPNPFALVGRPARQHFVACAVPRKHRVQFERCLSNGILTGGIPTVSRIKATALSCLGKVA